MVGEFVDVFGVDGVDDWVWGLFDVYGVFDVGVVVGDCDVVEFGGFGWCCGGSCGRGGGFWCGGGSGGVWGRYVDGGLG